MKLLTRILFAAICGLTVGASQAADVDQATRAAIEKSLRVVLPDAKPDSIQPAAIPGLYEVALGAQLLYMTPDGRYLVQGNVLDIQQRVNLTESRRSNLRLTALDRIGTKNMITFSPEKVRHSVTIFTDIDCGYCRKLHRELDDYLRQGIEVRYVMYPRTGVDSPSYDKAVSVWCAKDRKEALTRAKAEQAVEAKTCDNPVKRGMALGEQFGIQGTPTIITDTGSLLGGYVPAAQLAQVLEEQDASHQP